MDKKSLRHTARSRIVAVFSTKRNRVLAALGLATLALITGAVQLTGGHQIPAVPPSSVAAGQSTLPVKSSEAPSAVTPPITPRSPGPTFKPIAPSDKPQLARLGSAAYNATIKSYTYYDLFLGQPLQVSQQLVPANFKSAALATQTIATSVKATTTFSTKTGGQAYLASNPTSGLQTVIFSSHNLLIFVQSKYAHSLAEWASYLDSLQ
jgi:hypothetical protein